MSLIREQLITYNLQSRQEKPAILPLHFPPTPIQPATAIGRFVCLFSILRWELTEVIVIVKAINWC